MDEAGKSIDPQAPPPPKHKEGIKETIESILVAFILAFVFRAFVVEAFVIPSGSMAPTLLGGHMRFRCEDCGYEFLVNYPAREQGDNLNIPGDSPFVFSTHCPNCGFKVQRDRSNQRVPVYYGDRILVLKYLYLIQDPARWDVVVFKSPADIGRYETNYIKRLVGRPGETLMILDGDIYVCPNNVVDRLRKEHEAEDQRILEEWRRQQTEARRLNQTPPMRPLPLWVMNAPWQVQNKPRHVQESLWRVIYDNDFVPRNQTGRSPKWTFPWKQTEGSGWKLTDQADLRTLRFDSAGGAGPAGGTGRLTFDKDANSGTFPFSDWLPYNETMRADLAGDGYHVDAYARGMIPRWYVSDLKAKFSYQRHSGAGAMRVSMTKLGQAFTAELWPSEAKLLLDGRELGKAELKGPATGTLNVEFSNVDHTLTLRINGRDVIQTTLEQHHPDLRKLLELHRERDRLTLSGADHERIRNVFGPPRVELSADDQSCQISHLSLWRDIYYTPNFFPGASFMSLEHGSPERPIRLASPKDGKENEYFVLGDNSILSSDARAWNNEVVLDAENLNIESGRVPERFMLGKAFFVYWPAGYRPFSPTAPGIVPNFGEMRLIH